MPSRRHLIAKRGGVLPSKNPKAKSNTAQAGNALPASGGLWSAARAAKSSVAFKRALLQLQRKYGNQYVQKLLRRKGATEAGSALVQAKMMVNRAGDSKEEEADAVARSVVQREGQPEKAKDEEPLQLQAEDEEKKVQMQQGQEQEKDEESLQLQAEGKDEDKDEEPVQTKIENSQVNRTVADEDQKKSA